MKKILSFVLAAIMLLSVFALTACSDDSTAKASELLPGTYELTEKNVDKYIRVISNSYGEGRVYISKLDTYGYTDAGFSLDIFSNYIYPVEFNDVKLTYEVIYVYNSQMSFDTSTSIMSEPVTITVELKKTGTTTYNYAASVADAMKNNVYCKYALNPKVSTIELKEVTGSITFLER